MTTKRLGGVRGSALIMGGPEGSPGGVRGSALTMGVRGLPGGVRGGAPARTPPTARDRNAGLTQTKTETG